MKMVSSSVTIVFVLTSIAGLGFWANLLTMVSKLNQDVDRIAIRIDSQLSEMVAIPVSISFWYIVGLFSNVSRRFIHMQYVVRRKCGAGLIASGSVRTFKALVTLKRPLSEGRWWL